jgi:GAF domain-containing protein/ActR/RegA family two-component response regulator
VEQRARELEALAEASRLLTSTLDLGEVLDRLAEIARARLDVDVVRIWLLDESGEILRLHAQKGPTRLDVAAKEQLSPRESLSGWVLTHRRPLALSDVLQDPRLQNRAWFEAEGLVSFLCVPIMLDDGPIGIMACMTRQRCEFTDGDVALAEALAAPAAVAVRNAKVYADALQRVEEIQALQRVASETLSSPRLETALRAVVRETKHLLRADGALCSLVDRTGQVEILTAAGNRVEPVCRHRLASGEGLAGLVLAEKRLQRTDHYMADPRFTLTPRLKAWAGAEGVRAMIAAPVLDTDGQTIALLWAYNRTPRSFSRRDEAMLTGLTQQAALAIGKARAFEEERRRARQTAALLDVAQACTASLELKPLLKGICCQTARALGAERCAVFLFRDRHLVPVMGQFADGHRDDTMWARFKALANHWMEEVPAHAEAIRFRRPVSVTRGSGLLPARWFDTFGIRSALIVPLVSSDRVIGTMSLDDSRGPQEWDQGRRDLAMTVAAQVALAVDTARHYQAAQQRAAEVETLAAIGETLASTLELQKVLDAVAESATRLIGAQRAVVWELDEGSGVLRARAIRGIGIEPGLTIRLGQGAAGSAALRRVPMWSADVLTDPLPGYDEVHDQSGMLLGTLILKYGYRGILAVPVVSRGTALGAVCIYWDDVHQPDEREVRLLSALARQAAIAMDNARLVSDLRRTLDELKAAQDSLVQGATLRAVGELAAGAAHHLNNLMAVVLGRTQLLLMRGTDEEAERSLKTIERAAVDAADTVRRIQAFSKTRRGDEAASFNLNTAIQEAIEFTRWRWEDEAQIRRTPIDVVFQPGTIPEVAGRSFEIREVMTNLILNAVDALPTGGRISIATRAEPGRVVVTVQDTGTGMTDEVKRRAFEPFFTTKGVKRTGLGLAVAYGTVKRHGGQIALESGEAGGTTVTFWLPAVPAPEEVEPGPAAVPAETPSSILVIDDEADVRELVADVLAARGHAVTVAGSGREGLIRFETGRYDLVLTDLGMPDLNGWEVARSIKATRPATPVLLLTGWADAVDPSAETRVDGVVKKPFQIERLTAAVSAALAAKSPAPPP